MTHTENQLSPKAKSKPDPPRSEKPELNRFFNRDLSWLEFNRRVLGEAMKPDVPVLERLKFLSIFATNLDEFFMIRISGLKEQISEGIIERFPDGMTAREQLAEVTKRLRPMLKKQVSFLHENVLPELKKNNITIEPYASLATKEQRKLKKYFHENVYPILTPQSVDSSHPFPYISNLSLNLGLFIEPDRKYTRRDLKHLYRQTRFTRIKLPSSLPRLIPISDRSSRYVLLEEIIAANVGELFPHMKSSEAFVFRVTRDADLELREDEAGDLLRTLERELQRRRFRFPVRLEISSDMSPKMLEVLTAGIGLNEDDVYRIEGLLDIPDLMQLYTPERDELQDDPIPVVYPELLLRSNKNAFEVLKKHDILVHHPYTAYSTVTDFIAAAAEDPDVQAIKICLYRTGKDSPIVRSLITASEHGKQVTALVELKARFDEEKNIEWARRLENEGVHVVYGVNSLKTHSKVLLVVRREKNKLVRYVHIATGNYNPTTAKLYTDIGLLTSDEAIGGDATSLFNVLTGYSQEDSYSKLVVAPHNLRRKFTEFIRRETENKKAGKPARIIAKMNSLTDESIVEELYAASNAGVQIDLIVRGVCTLKPRIKGLSANIRVRSIIGRFLEHSRIFYFANGGGENEEIYIGSADWMLRNLDRRVEVIVPISDPTGKKYLKEEVLESYLRDNVNAHWLAADGSYKKVTTTGELFDSQMYFAGREIPH